MVNEQKFVLGGNGRTMATMLAYGEGNDRPKEYLRKHAREFGLKKEDIDHYAEPMVVRTIRTGGEDPKTLASWSRRLNAALSQQLDKVRLAVSRARFIDSSVLRQLDKMGPEESLSDFLTSERSVDFVKALQKSGVIDSRSARLYLTGEGLLNADGRGLVVELLVARMLGSADLIESLGPGVIETLARSAGYFIPTENLEQYNLIPYLRAAAAARAEMREQRFTSMKQYLRQGLLGQKQRSKEEELFFLIFYELESAPIRMARFAKKYLQLSKAAGFGQASMFGAPTVLGNLQEAAREANVKL